jgi:hypothetical protein
MAGPERAATVAALMSLIRSTSESPAGDGGAFSFVATGAPPACSEGYELEAPGFVLIEVTIPYV